MDILSSLNTPQAWEAFFAYKNNGVRSTLRESAALRRFIDCRGYEAVTLPLLRGQYTFSVPKKHLINKKGSAGKKRAVYQYNEEETYIFKLISYLLYRYDGVFSENLYSFRKEFGVKKAFSFLAGQVGRGMASYKVDVSDYFNSIDVTRLLPMVRSILQKEDMALYCLLEELLLNPQVSCKGCIIEEKKGIMAGFPLSAFLANVYLGEMDRYFAQRKVLYARYSDDIIVFAPPEEIGGHEAAIKDFLCRYGLKVNPAKEKRTLPGERWEFLGFSCGADGVDLSLGAKQKIMAKIRRKAKKLRRWSLGKENGALRALKAMNRAFNKKFYSPKQEGLCWSLWYFPLLTKTDSLKEIDAYMQQWQRWILTGKHNKRNYAKAPYALLKACGYRPLLSAYYQNKQEPAKAPN